MSARRHSSHANLRAQYGFSTEPAPFDPRPLHERDTIIEPHAEDLLMRVDDPVIRADVIAEQTDHAPLQTMAVHEPQDKPAHPLVRMARDAGCWVFDLFAPDSAHEKPISAERRAAMEFDRWFLKQVAIWLGQAVCMCVIGYAILRVLAAFGWAWGTA